MQPSRAESARATTDRTDAQTQKEQVRFMKITQNVISDSAVYRLVGRLCQTPRRFTEWSRRAPSDIDGQPGGRANRERASQTPYSRIAPALFGICMTVLSATVFAENADNIAEREVQRRQSGIPQGEAAL